MYKEGNICTYVRLTTELELPATRQTNSSKWNVAKFSKKYHSLQPSSVTSKLVLRVHYYADIGAERVVMGHGKLR